MKESVGSVVSILVVWLVSLPSALLVLFLFVYFASPLFHTLSGVFVVLFIIEALCFGVTTPIPELLLFVVHHAAAGRSSPGLLSDTAEGSRMWGSLNSCVVFKLEGWWLYSQAELIKT